MTGMIIPAAMFIEEAQDLIKDSYPSEQVEKESKEFKLALGNKATSEMIQGYILGLATARTLLMQNLKAVEAGVKI